MFLRTYQNILVIEYVVFVCFSAIYVVHLTSLLTGIPSADNAGTTHPCRDSTFSYTATSVSEVGSWYDWSWESTSGRVSIPSGHTAIAVLISGKFWYHSSWEVHAVSTQVLRISINDQPPHSIPLYGAISGSDIGIGHLKIAAAEYAVPLSDGNFARRNCLHRIQSGFLMHGKHLHTHMQLPSPA